MIYINGGKGEYKMSGSTVNWVADLSFAVINIAIDYAKRTSRTLDNAIDAVLHLVQIGVQEGLKQCEEDNDGNG